MKKRKGKLDLNGREVFLGGIEGMDLKKIRRMRGEREDNNEV